MLYYTHISTGLAVYSSSVYLLSTIGGIPMTLETALLGAGVAIVGSILPDIDSTSNKISQFFLPLSVIISRLFSHRTVTHNIFFVALFFILAIINNSFYLWVLAISVGWHVLMDSFSLLGVLWLYPFEKWHFYKSGGRYKKGRPYGTGYRVGGKFESVIFVISSVYFALISWIVLPLLQ